MSTVFPYQKPVHTHATKHATNRVGKTSLKNCQILERMSWESWVFPLQYWDFLHLKSNFPHLISNFPCMKSDLPKLAFYFLQQLSAFFNGFLTFFNGFPLSLMAFQISPTAFQFSSMAFHFPRNLSKSIHGEKYTKDCYSSFVFFTTCSPSFVVPAKQYLHLTQHTGCQICPHWLVSQHRKVA